VWLSFYFLFQFLAVFATHPRQEGILQAAPGRAVITPQTPFYSYAAGFPLKSVGGREKVSLTPALSSRPDCQSGSKAPLIAPAAWFHHLLQAAIIAPGLMPLFTRVSCL